METAPALRSASAMNVSFPTDMSGSVQTMNKDRVWEALREASIAMSPGAAAGRRRALLPDAGTLRTSASFCVEEIISSTV